MNRFFVFTLLIAFIGAAFIWALPMVGDHGDGCLVASLFGKAICWGALSETAARHIAAYWTLTNIPAISFFAAFLFFAFAFFTFLSLYARGRPRLYVISRAPLRERIPVPKQSFYSWFSLHERSPSFA